MGKEDNVKIHLTKKEIKGKEGRKLVDRLLRLGFAITVVKNRASRFDRR